MQNSQIWTVQDFEYLIFNFLSSRIAIGEGQRKTCKNMFYAREADTGHMGVCILKQAYWFLENWSWSVTHNGWGVIQRAKKSFPPPFFFGEVERRLGHYGA